jgi:drug/metabolite transporter (DMT)-like permease
VLDLSLTVIIWGFSFVLAKKALNSFTPFELVTIRLFLGGVTAWALARFFAFRVGGRRLTASLGPREARFVSSRYWRSAIVLGVFEFAGTYLLYTWSLMYLPSGVVAALTLMTPIFAYLIGLSVRTETFSKKALFATILGFLGAACALPVERIFSGIRLDTATLFGCALITASNLFFAIGNVLITKFERVKRWDNIITAKAQLVGAAVAFGAVLFTWGTPMGGAAPGSVTPWERLGGLAGNPRSWILPVYLGIVATGLGFFLWNRGVQKVEATKATLVGNFKGPLAVVWGAIFLGEAITLRLVAGVVLLMVATQILPRRRGTL